MPAKNSDDAGVWAVRGIIIATLVFLPWGFNPWVLPKLAVGLAACALAFFVPPAGRLPRWVWGVVVAGAVLLAIAAGGGDAPLAQLLGRFPRYEGVVALGVYVAALWAGARLLGPSAPPSRRLVFGRGVALGSIALALVSLAQATGLQFWPSSLERPGALLGNATDQGIVGAMFCLLLLPSLSAEWLRPAPVGKLGSARPFLWMALWGVLSGIATVALSASRGAMLALGVGLLVWTLCEVVREGPSRRRLTVVGVGATTLVTAAVAVLVVPLSYQRLTGQSPLASATVGERLAMYEQAWQLITSSPLQGAGPSGFVDAVPDVQSAGWFQLAGSDAILDSPHMWVLQAGVAGGLPLLVLAVGAVVALAVSGIRRWRAAVAARSNVRADGLLGAGAALVAFGVGISTHFTIAGTTVLAAFLVGALVSLQPRPQSTAGGRLPAVVGGTVLMAGALVLGAGAVGEVPLSAGLSAAARGDLAGAASGIEAARILRPWDLDIDNLAAQAFAQAADSGQAAVAGEAIAHANRALARTPRSFESALALAVAFRSDGQVGEAEAVLLELHERSPDHPVVLVRLADVRLAQGAVGEARELLLRASVIDPRSATVWTALLRFAEATADELLIALASEQLVSLVGK